MKVIKATTDLSSLPLGRQGENGRTMILFDVKDLQEEYPEAEIIVVNQKPKTYSAYACELEATDEEGVLSWTITSEDLTIEGTGCCQLQATDGTTIARERTWETSIERGLPYTAPAEEETE